MKWKRREMTHTLVFGDFSWNTHMTFPLHLHWPKKVAWPCLSVRRWKSSIRWVPGRRPGDIWWMALMTVTDTMCIPTTPCSWPPDINPSYKVLGFLFWIHMAHDILLRGTCLWGGMRVVTSTGLKQDKHAFGPGHMPAEWSLRSLWMHPVSASSSVKSEEWC